ncbi:hypothetical protein, partial [Pseudomonas sp. 2822-17]|uniref:hypothetical protein n=1 Tax=Pseudomonas sp. 2822-17 TaxID=1712678 RepID=UPI00130479BE
VVGCVTESDEVKRTNSISELKPSEDNQFNVVAFFESIPSEGNENEVYEMAAANMPLNKIHSYYLFQSNSEHVDNLNISDFPTFLVLDSSGVNLQTSDINELLE